MKSYPSVPALFMTPKRLREMFEGDFEDTRTEKIPLVLMGGRAERQVCADPAARTQSPQPGFCKSMEFRLAFV